MRKIVRTITTRCPKCGVDLNWDAFGHDSKDNLEITCWCDQCKDHCYVVVLQGKKEK